MVDFVGPRYYSCCGFQQARTLGDSNIAEHFVQEPWRRQTRGVPGRTEPESYKVLPVREFFVLHFGPAGSEALRSGVRANAGPGGSGEFQFKQEMVIVNCYLSGRPLVCTSARPLRKHFDQEPLQMSTRRVPI